MRQQRQLFFMLFLVCFLFKCGSAFKMSMQFEAIYQFGDSLNDNGNFIRLPTGWHSAYGRLPYGQALKMPTGRASDGLVIGDFIASYFQLPQLNPYLAYGSDFSHGVNFAVVGATATGGGRTISLADQLSWFKYYLASSFTYPTAIKEKLEKSLVIMGEIGGNDFNGPFYAHKTISEVSLLVPKVVKTVKDAIEFVISIGATNIVVPGNFAIGCVPLYLVEFATNDTSKYDEYHCLKDYNQFARFYNQELIKVIKELQYEHPNVAIVYADYYSALISVVRNAQQLGFEQDGIEKACCGDGNNPYNYGEKGCGSVGATVCEDPSKRLNWDGVHMTQHGYKCVVDSLVKQFVPALERQIRRRRRNINHT
ncbi:acetylajmalan esterase-like [Amaranthus tricolor]|uniref:acetylajmalan esterase-like n=1 Tax=Amaranthus tricolor TaxID=29722 RepID=UPI00258A3C76|nr:acetylajmalan esterase-like [Amaranthus tricolor]